MQLALAKIRTNGGTQMREVLLRDVVEDYKHRYSEMEKMPAIDVFFDGETYWLADGFHRYYGCRDAGIAEIPATIHAGTQRDAVLFAVGANAAHGLRRTNQDKRIAVATMLRDPEWSQWSDRKIAEMANVGHPLVAAVRAEVEEIPPDHDETESTGNTSNSHARTGRDGKRYPSKPRSEAKPDLPIGDEPQPAQDKPDKDAAALADLCWRFDELPKTQRLNFIRYTCEQMDDTERLVAAEWLTNSGVETAW